MEATPRTRYLDGLRGLAALQVILHHTYLTVYPLDQGVYPTGLTKLATSSMMISGLGVTVFIVLSGYALSMSAHRRGWALPGGTMPFLRRRARRLLPVYYVVLAVSLVLGLTVLSEETGAHWDISVPFSGLDVLGHLLVLQDVIGQPYAINHPLWSIALTFHLYLLFPVLLACAVRWGIGRVAVWALALTTPIAVAAFMTPGSVLILRQLQFVGVFAAGMATLAIVRADGVVTVRGRERRPPWPALAVVLFMVWAAAPLNHLNHVPFALGVCCLLVALGTGESHPPAADARVARHRLDGGRVAEPVPHPRAHRPWRVAHGAAARGTRCRRHPDPRPPPPAGGRGVTARRLAVSPVRRAAPGAAGAGARPAGRHRTRRRACLLSLRRRREHTVPRLGIDRLSVRLTMCVTRSHHLERLWITL
ncbi:acyltransferase [Svornostia abyssi]|uniref:Acyltransferase n=1 Tax=Svornostia abyssi TaxID=2898438 RepID=A0ABY5PKU9_9ACTN|nr:acyltransferase [Parviterribacteraceae bacterium J379]